MISSHDKPEANSAARPAGLEGAWHVVNGNGSYRIATAGDPFGIGARLRVDSIPDLENSELGGAMNRVSTEAPVGKEAVLTAHIEASGNVRGVAIWMHADSGEGERTAFVSSARFPIACGQSAVRREIFLRVPQSTEWLYFGIVLTGAGSVTATEMRLEFRSPDPPMTGEQVAKIRDDAITFVREHALESDRIDWIAVIERSPPDETIDSIHVVIRELLSQLVDYHGTFLSADEARQLDAMGLATGSISVALLDNSTGYIQMPGFIGADELTGRDFAESVSAQIAALADRVKAGWILDLRQNRGGNMWPMLSALKALLGDASPGSFRPRNGSVAPWKIEATKSTSKRDLTHSKVAVLLSELTASAGKALAVCFHARPKTKSFGSPTAGRATGNAF